MVIDQVMECLHVANNFFETCKPWELTNKPTDTKTIQHRDTILSITMETLRVCGIICQPIIPTMSEQLLDKLNVDKRQRNWSNLAYFRWNDDVIDDKLTLEKSLGSGNSVLFNRIRLPTNNNVVQSDTNVKMKKR